MVEMILICKLIFSLIPCTIPVLATAAIDAKIPMRFGDPDLQENQQLVNDVPADIDSDLNKTILRMMIRICSNVLALCQLSGSSYRFCLN